MKNSVGADALPRLDTDYSPTHPPSSSRTGFILIHSPASTHNRSHPPSDVA
jgi:hypothetical protein